jgi:DNA-binding transcriptional ArsR family regulator
MTYPAAFAALGDPTRFELVQRLRRLPCSVVELSEGLPISRPAVSQHLKVLKEAGLVIDRAEGTRRIYQIDPEGFEALREWLEPFWGEALSSFQAEVARRRKARRTK